MPHLFKDYIMFSYLGGKKFQAKWIADHFPEFDNYVEPFGGAMWVYFQSTVNGKLNVYNDYNEYLVNIFECATRKPGEFLKELNKHKVQDRKLFEQFKKDLMPLDGRILAPNPEVAAKYLYVELQTFSGLRWDQAKYVDLKGKYKSKYNHFIDKLTNPKYIKKLNNLDAYNMNWRECIQFFDSKDTLFYVDPPYYNMEFYYTQNFDNDQHKQLALELQKVRGKFALSYYHFDKLEEWYPKSKFRYVTKSFNKQNSTKKKNTDRGDEILIMNY